MEINLQTKQQVEEIESTSKYSETENAIISNAKDVYKRQGFLVGVKAQIEQVPQGVEYDPFADAVPGDVQMCLRDSYTFPVVKSVVQKIRKEQVLTDDAGYEDISIRDERTTTCLLYTSRCFTYGRHFCR